jgi:lysophospholipase L1-like esterase
MRHIYKTVIICSLLILFTNGCVTAEHAVTNGDTSKFELHHGDRVVFLGNSLIQNDLEYGYIEYALTTRWPERDITFRNLGWTGDNVHGEARSYYTTPPDSYELLIKQLKEANPTVVFIGYGANEAYEGEEGVPKFKKGLNKLLDEVEKMEARAILLSPIPQMSGLLPEELAARNENLKLYSSVISQTASKRNIRYINLFSSFQKLNHKKQLTTDGIHLNESGYYYLASVIEDGLGLSARKWKVEIDFSEQMVDATGPTTILESQLSAGNIKFTMDAAILSLPPPKSDTAVKIHGRGFKIDGLKNRCYTLRIGTVDVASASAERWSTGVEIKQGVLFRQANKLRNLIVNKNQLFFRKYRPTNRTYLVGFRSFEQGQNKKELEQLDLFISRLEDQIFQLRKSNPKVYQINAVK